MPEYLAPGVFVEETSYRAKSLEGVSTTTTGFVGPTRSGPDKHLPPVLVTSLGEFEQTFGDRQPLVFSDETAPVPNETRVPNDMWHAARAFFNEGGRRLYIARIHNGAGHASTTFGAPDHPVTITARHPGRAGRFLIDITLSASRNILAFAGGEPRFGSLRAGDTVLIQDVSSPFVAASSIGSPPVHPPGTGALPATQASTAFWVARRRSTPDRWEFTNAQGDILLEGHLSEGDDVRIVTATVAVTSQNEPATVYSWSSLQLSLSTTFPENAPNAELVRTLPIHVTGDASGNGARVANAIASEHSGDMLGALYDEDATPASRTIHLALSGGDDGVRPTAADYEGTEDAQNRKTGLKALEDIPDISIVAAPGHTRDYASRRTEADTIAGHLISHATRMRYRIAVLDAGDALGIAAVRAQRAPLDSKYAALYYPWVRILDPVTNAELDLPPSGFVAGIYARNDNLRAVYKAPANEVVRSAIGLESLVNTGQQEVLNPEGINCLRLFPGRGYRVWGARTISSDPEWKYVNIRRYFNYLEHTLDRGTQWVVFEPNGEALWENVTRTVSDFLFNEWRSGALLGRKAEEAYFVRCDRSTMTQNDIDNGRLVCEIGVAALKPAEFVIFRIGQWTAGAGR